MTDSRDDHIVADYGDGHPVEAIAARYGLTVEQVYMVVQRETGPAPAYYQPTYHQPTYAAPPVQPTVPPGYRDVDTIVAEYGAGYDVQWIAFRHGLSVEWVYYLVGQAVKD